MTLTRTQSQPAVAKAKEPQIWWSNALFFVGVHLAAAVGVYYRPLWVVNVKTLVFAFLVWQLADFGITIGYHRLYSHKAFRASAGVRVVLALLGAVAFQGSIKVRLILGRLRHISGVTYLKIPQCVDKWWCLRHRLHHRYTDDPIHDPYAATRGFLYSHMGWIFFKPNYEKMDLIERDDLERDPVVRFQHKYYVLLATTLGFGVPPLVGLLWKEPLGALIWAGLVSRLLIWHCTFLVNSLAHMNGLQPYSDEDTSRGNLVLALLTGGEGNHNFHHTFPHDFRSGPSIHDWDPSKWIILALHYFGLATGLRQAREVDIKESLQHMYIKAVDPDTAALRESENIDNWSGETWELRDLLKYQEDRPAACLLLLDGYVVDVTRYLGEHPGGAGFLRSHSIRTTHESKHKVEGADWAFYGGFNNHSRAAKKRMHEMRIARINAMEL